MLISELFFKWIKQHLRHQEVPRDERKCRPDPDLVRRLNLRADRDQEGAQAGGIPVHNITDSVDLRLRLSPYITSIAAGTGRRRYAELRETVALFDF
jgi:transposase-like protein